MSSPKREALLSQLTGKLRQNASLSIVMGQAAADCLGINATDLNCLNIVSLKGSVAPSELAAATGLTTASITGVVDRLEGAGFVTRERDPHDRRKINVKLDPARAKADVVPTFKPVMEAWREALSDFSDAELETIVEHYSRIEVVTRRLLASFHKCAHAGQPAAFALSDSDAGQEPARS